jgi:hypothetical protein
LALSNHRLVKLEEGKVTFRHRDYADARKEKLLTRSALSLGGPAGANDPARVFQAAADPPPGRVQQARN